jgi:hypothetical protein
MDIETYAEFWEMVELLQGEECEKKAKLTVKLQKIKKVAQQVCLPLSGSLPHIVTQQFPR